MMTLTLVYDKCYMTILSWSAVDSDPAINSSPEICINYLFVTV